jgi:hypothetical protein
MAGRIVPKRIFKSELARVAVEAILEDILPGRLPALKLVSN